MDHTVCIKRLSTQHRKIYVYTCSNVYFVTLYSFLTRLLPELNARKEKNPGRVQRFASSHVLAILYIATGGA